MIFKKRKSSLPMRSLIKSLLFISILVNAVKANAQTYADSIAAYRKQYVADLLADKRSPIKASQTKNLSFFPTDHSYCVLASVTLSPGAVPFLVDTHSGKQKPFKEYCTLSFTVHDSAIVLHVYQSINLMNDAAHKDDLFLPFTDESNYETTYGGGRYLDLSIKDIKDNTIVLDFNKCYNPYCAYAGGYSCPIPPKENSLHLEINAGEKVFSQ